MSQGRKGRKRDCVALGLVRARWIGQFSQQNREKPMRILILLAAGAALAHSGVKNPAVQARMDNMGQIAAQTKLLGTMAKGQTPFDAAQAQAALVALGSHARQISGLFAAPEHDPKSEALPLIWQDYGDFTAKAQALITATEMPVADLPQLRDTMGQIGASCAACHKAYRQ